MVTACRVAMDTSFSELVVARLHQSLGLEIATDTVANATKMSAMATKSSGFVAKMATKLLCIEDA